MATLGYANGIFRFSNRFEEWPYRRTIKCSFDHMLVRSHVALQLILVVTAAVLAVHLPLEVRVQIPDLRLGVLAAVVQHRQRQVLLDRLVQAEAGVHVHDLLGLEIVFPGLVTAHVMASE